MTTRSRARMLTASGLWRHLICIGSAVLERAGETNEWSERGTGIHGFLLAVSRIGRDAALAEIKDDKLRSACELLNTARLPVDPKLYAAEVAFAFDTRTGRARELGRAIDRDYVGHGATPDDICGSADVVALVGTDAVYVGDYKSGFKHLPQPVAMWQFRFLALAAARAYGRDRVLVEIIRLGKDGEPYRIGGEVGLFELAEIAEQLRELHADQARYAAADVDPPLVTGSHCSGCESISFCPASTAMIRAASSSNDAQALAPLVAIEDKKARKAALGDAVIVGVAAQLTEEHALEALGQVDALEVLVEKLRQQIDDYASVHPIRLPNGQIYGPVERSKSSPEGEKVWHFLSEKFGPEAAWKAVKLTSTWTAIGELAGRVAKETGRKKTHVEREMKDELYALRAVKSVFYQSVMAHKPGKEEP